MDFFISAEEVEDGVCWSAVNWDEDSRDDVAGKENKNNRPNWGDDVVIFFVNIQEEVAAECAETNHQDFSKNREEPTDPVGDSEPQGVPQNEIKAKFSRIAEVLPRKSALLT